MNDTRNPKLNENARQLRKNMTKEEKHLWYDFLKQLPCTVYRQKIIGNYIVDFYCVIGRTPHQSSHQAELCSPGVACLRTSCPQHSTLTGSEGTPHQSRQAVTASPQGEALRPVVTQSLPLEGKVDAAGGRMRCNFAAESYAAKGECGAKSKSEGWSDEDRTKFSAITEQRAAKGECGAKYVIELDGTQHYEEEGHRKDLKRDAYLASQGITVLRYSNRDVNQHFKMVCADIWNHIFSENEE